MDFISFLGAAGTVLGLIRAVPQLVRLLRARQAHGVSLDTAATSSIVSFGWAAYGILSHQLYVSFATGSSGLIFALITLFAIRFGRRLREFKVAPVWLGVLLLAGVVAGKNGLGLLLPVSVLAANIPQLWVAYKEGNLAELSLGTWLLSIADGLVWGSYALLRQDVSIMVYGLFQLLTSGPIVLLKLLHLPALVRREVVIESRNQAAIGQLSMKTIFSAPLKFLASLVGKKEPAPVPCSFCGQVGHEKEDCPAAAKYKLFHVDRE